MRKRYEKIMGEAPKATSTWRLRRLRRWMAAILVLILALVVAAGALAWKALRPAQGAGVSSAAASAPPVESTGGELPVPDNAWALAVVSPAQPAAADWKPQLTGFDNVQVDARIVPALQKLTGDAKAKGYTLALDRGYVDAQQQEQLYQQRVQELMQRQGLTRAVAESTASAQVARGGYGESQTGLSVDFGGGDAFLTSDAYHWLADKCVDYGFVRRYTAEKEGQTGLAENAYHFRYVGTRNAQAMRRMGLCLEEYVAYLAQQDTAG